MEPPHTVPHGRNRRGRVFQLREHLLRVAAALTPEHRERLVAAAERAEVNPDYHPDWQASLDAARALG